jgi:hypothetical protein
VTPRYIVREVLEIGGRVLLRGDWGGEGRASGIETLSNLSVVCTVQGGRIRKAEFFFEHSEALEAVGLEG